jgi:hypothetical protein
MGSVTPVTPDYGLDNEIPGNGFITIITLILILKNAF